MHGLCVSNVMLWFTNAQWFLLVCRLNLQLDLECAGSMASLEKLSGLFSSLGCARDQRKAAVEALHGKHAKIQEFAQVAVCRMFHC